MEKPIRKIIFPIIIGLVLTLPLLTLPGAGQALAEVDRQALARTLAQLDKESGDKTLSPFFFVGGGDPQVDQLPLKSTDAQVRIAGVMAEVTVTQVYKNQGKKTLEAIYIFPGSTRAAVHALRMTIGDRIVEAEIMEREKARKTYEEAKQQGQTASLLEQQRPNVFQMNVANILPGDEIKVELKYNELIVPEEGVYQFVYPAVVGAALLQCPGRVQGRQAGLGGEPLSASRPGHALQVRPER